DVGTTGVVASGRSPRLRWPGRAALPARRRAPGRPGLLSPATAQHLREPAGNAVFISDRITYTLDATAIVVDRATILGSMMEIRTERAVTGLSLRWGAAG
ncbi:transcriptional regulator, partial [Micromonospora sp. NPDC051296]